jgi:hypothetical protein
VSWGCRLAIALTSESGCHAGSANRARQSLQNFKGIDFPGDIPLSPDSGDWSSRCRQEHLDRASRRLVGGGLSGPQPQALVEIRTPLCAPAGDSSRFSLLSVWPTRYRFLMPSFSTAIRCRRCDSTASCCRRASAISFPSTGIAVTYSSFCCRPPSWSSSAASARARHSTHPVDARLSLEICIAQLDVFRRRRTSAPVGFLRLYPRRRWTPAAALCRTVAAVNTLASRRPFSFRVCWRAEARGCQTGLRLGSQSQAGRRLSPGQHQGAGAAGWCADRDHPWPERQEASSLSRNPTQRAGTGTRQGSNFIIVDPLAHPGQIGGFLRLTPKSWVSLGSGDVLQQALFDYPAAVDEEHLVVIHGRDALIFRNLSDAGTAIGPAFREARWVPENRFRRLREIFGGPIELLPKDEALQLIEEVNRLLQQESLSSEGRPRHAGWVADAAPEADSDSGCRPACTDRQSADCVEPERFPRRARGGHCRPGDSRRRGALRGGWPTQGDGRVDAADGSDLPAQAAFSGAGVLFRGNHDSFSEDIAKDGIPQGLLWGKELAIDGARFI